MDVGELFRQGHQNQFKDRRRPETDTKIQFFSCQLLFNVSQPLKMRLTLFQGRRPGSIADVLDVPSPTSMALSTFIQPPA